VSGTTAKRSSGGDTGRAAKGGGGAGGGGDASPHGHAILRYCQAGDWEAVKLEAKKPDSKVTIEDESFGWTPGHFAANTGDATVLTVLLHMKAKIDAVDHEGNTMLMLAGRMGHCRATEFLIGKKADMNLQNNQGWTALVWVAINGHEDTATTLLNASCDYFMPDKEGRTACMWAARHGHLGLVETLLAYGLNLSVKDNAGLTILDHCQDHLDMATTILAVDEVNHCLQAAAMGNDLESCRAAIEAGADVDTRDGDGWTPLLWAAMHQSLDMVQLVVRYGANPTLLDQHGDVIQGLTTQHLQVGEAIEAILEGNARLLQAAKESNWEWVAEELANGAFINVRDDSQRTALMYAAKHCSAEGVELLLNKSCFVNDRDSFGWAAVHYAVTERSCETVSMFHYLGADLNVKTYEGDGLLHMAVRADDSAMIQLLLAASLDIEDVEVNLLTPLMMAGQHGLSQSAQTLLAYGANIEAQSTEALGARSAVALAIVEGHEGTAAVFLQPLVAPPKLPCEVESGTGKGKTNRVGMMSSSFGLSTTEVAKKAPSGGPSAKAKAAAGGVAARRKAAPKAKLQIRGSHPNALMDAAVARRGQQPWKNVANPAKIAVKQLDGDGSSPLALAVRYKRTVTGALLLHNKADPNAADDVGTTVLMEAVMTRQTEIVERLVALGAKVEKKNKYKQDAIDVCEDAVIRQYLNRKIALDRLAESQSTEKPGLIREENEDEEEEDVEPPEPGPESLGFAVRVENLPTKKMTQAMLEKQVRGVMKRCGAPNPPLLKVEIHAITGLPLGHAYAYFLDAVSQDLAMRGHGDEVMGHPVRIIKEPVYNN